MFSYRTFLCICCRHVQHAAPVSACVAGALRDAGTFAKLSFTVLSPTSSFGVSFGGSFGGSFGVSFGGFASFSLLSLLSFSLRGLCLGLLRVLRRLRLRRLRRLRLRLLRLRLLRRLRLRPVGPTMSHVSQSLNSVLIFSRSGPDSSATSSPSCSHCRFKPGMRRTDRATKRASSANPSS